MLSPFRLRLITRHLYAGGLIAYPTEGVYGLGCHPLDAQAVSRLLAIKGRSAAKGLIVVAADWSQLEPLLAPLDEDIQLRVRSTWPGPQTWILPAAEFVPVWLRGRHRGLAARVSAHPVIRALCLAFGGPLVSTSANRSGRPPARRAMPLRRLCRSYPDVLLVPGALGGLRKPTPIHDALTGHILR